jgi:hypothetical protein
MLLFHFCLFLIVAAFQQLFPHNSLCTSFPISVMCPVGQLIPANTWRRSQLGVALWLWSSEVWCHAVCCVGTKVLEEPVASWIRVHSECHCDWKCRQQVSALNIAYWRSVRLILTAESIFISLVFENLIMMMLQFKSRDLLEIKEEPWKLDLSKETRPFMGLCCNSCTSNSRVSIVIC